jgi:hypothetical protein
LTAQTVLVQADRVLRTASIQAVALLCAGSACAPGVFDKLSGKAPEPEAGQEAEAGPEAEEDGGAFATIEAGAAAGDGEAGADPSAESGAPDVSVAQAVCQPGSTECVNTTTERTCNGSGQWDEPTPCANACVGARCAGDCRPGQRQCRDKQRQLCSDQGAWTDDGAACPNLCQDGACAGSCTPSASQCISATQLQTCNGSGQWDPAKACQFACIGDRCGGDCVPGTRSCGAGNVPRVCNGTGSWRSEAACAGMTPICQGAGVCRCRTGQRRCRDTQPQVCSAAGQWINTGIPCANCTGEGQCPGEGCSEERVRQCGEFCGCGCVNNECNGGFAPTGDGCTNERRTACANAGCRCVDGACSGGMCDGTGCTPGRAVVCKEMFGEQCDCALGECVGNCVPQ